jgi:hypothetical protein
VAGEGGDAGGDLAGRDLLAKAGAEVGCVGGGGDQQQ